VIPRGANLGLGRSFVGRRYHVAVAELALLLLFLLWAGSWSFTLLLLKLTLAESNSFFPIGVVSGQIEELADGFRLDTPYPVDKDLARGTIFESSDDLIVGRVGELSAALGEAANVVAETLTLLLPAMAKFARVAKPRVAALEVSYEGVPELGQLLILPRGRFLSQVRAESARYSGMLLMMNRSLVVPPLWQARR
jgi:hypothetical protein